MGFTHPRIRGSGEGERWAAPGGPFLAGPTATWTPVTQQICPLPMPGPDLDECRVRSLCQHACRNTEGSYQCLCPAGYRLLPSGKNCQGEPGPGRAGGPGTPLPQTAPAGLGAGERLQAGSELSPAGPGHVHLQPPGWAHLADVGRAGESGLPCLSAPPLAVTGLVSVLRRGGTH